MEKWKIINAEKCYEVSSLGLVHNSRKVKDGCLKPSLRNNYYSVRINIGEGLKQYNIHRLVAIAFIPNPDNKPQVNHINGVKTDNRVENLEWVTASQNGKHSYTLGLSKPAGNRRGHTGDRNKTNKHVLQIDLLGNIVKEYESISLTKVEGFTPSCVGRCAQGLLIQHKGYKWKYAT